MEGFRRSGWKIWIIDAGISPDTPVGERDYGDGIFELRFVPPFLTLSRRRRIGRLFTILKAACITRRLKKEAVRLIRAQKMTGTDTVLYAHEIFGVAAAAALRRRFGIPTVSRFCGVWDKAACPDTFFNRFRLYPAFQAYATPADLVLMTNDGTWGDQLLQRLKNPGPVVFWRNGVDIPGPAGEGPDCLKSLSPEDEVLVTVSRLWAGKRVDGRWASWRRRPRPGPG